MTRDVDGEAPELDLTPFVMSTRRVLDQVARDHDPEAGPEPVPAPRGSNRIALLVAAAVVLLMGGIVALTAGDSVRVGANVAPSQAERSTVPGGPSLAMPGRESSGRASYEALVRPEATRPEAGALEIVGPGPTAAPEQQASASVEPPSGRRSADAGPTAPATLADLDAEAQRQWRAGNTKRAESLFLEIVERGGRTRYAELAFGDLFILAHQAGDARLEQRRWRQYLARFPTGRFADEVRAGQCRRTSDEHARRCWQRYLADWPRGAHREEASRGAPPSPAEDR